MNTLKRIVNVKGWKKKTKIVTIVVIIAIIEIGRASCRERV